MTGHLVEPVRRDSGELKAHAEVRPRLEEGFDAWVEEALRPLEGADAALVRSLVDHGAWSAMRPTASPIRRPPRSICSTPRPGGLAG